MLFDVELVLCEIPVPDGDSEQLVVLDVDRLLLLLLDGHVPFDPACP